MPRRVYTTKSNQEAKQLAILIYDFLLDECSKKYAKRTKRHLDRAVSCLEKAYKIGFIDYVIPKFYHSLEEIFAVGSRPVPVKARLAAKSHKLQGNEYMELEMYKFAEKSYSCAVYLDSTNAIYYCNRAAARIRLGTILPAIADCNKALELDRHYAKAYGWLGIAHVMMDHPARAIRCYRKALRIEPDNQACLANMELISSRMNRIAFRFLKPLFSLFRRKNQEKTDRKESEIKTAKVVKYTMESLD